MKRSRGFSLTELMVASLLIAALGMGVTSYLKKSKSTMVTGDINDTVRNSSSFVQKLLTSDLQQVVYLNPSCDTNQASSVATTLCSNVKVRGGITPLPGLDKTGVNALTSFGLPGNITASTASLSNSNDGIRLLEFNFANTFTCRLNPRHSGVNPSQTSGTGSGAERMWAHPQCAGNLSVGGLYVLMQEFSSVVYSNVFQITAMSTVTLADTTTELQIDAQSTSNSFNQPGGLGLSGYTNEARIYPVKFVEWTADSTGLWKRDITPTSTNMTGYQSWVKIQGDVEGIQFYPLTVPTAGPVEHQRTMQYTSDTANNGIEDIRGVSPRFVIKSNRATQEIGKTYTNPLLSSPTADAYPRKETKFFVNLKNY